MHSYTRRTWAEINLDNLAHNYRHITRQLGTTRVIATVKADAYGHGEQHVASTLEKLGAQWFSVSNIDEAMALRRHGIRGDILILGFTPLEDAKELAEHQLTQTIFSHEYARELSSWAQSHQVTLPVHIKIDTGMTRIGFLCNGYENDLEGVRSLYSLPGLRITGTFSHLSHADSTDPDAIAFTQAQARHFDETVSALKQLGCDPGLTHLQNSAGVICLSGGKYDLARPGISLYGLNPSAEVTDGELRPVLQLKSVISMVKQVGNGIPVGYGRSYVTSAPTRIATVPVGYADGYSRLLSNKGSVLVGGKRAPIIGNVCMDQLMIDVTGIDAAPGDEVTLIGTDGNLSVSADDLADLIGTISYEIVCMISKRVPRVYYQDGKLVDNVSYI